MSAITLRIEQARPQGFSSFFRSVHLKRGKRPRIEEKNSSVENMKIIIIIINYYYLFFIIIIIIITKQNNSNKTGTGDEVGSRSETLNE